MFKTATLALCMTLVGRSVVDDVVPFLWYVFIVQFRILPRDHMEVEVTKVADMSLGCTTAAPSFVFCDTIIVCGIVVVKVNVRRS